MQPDVLYILLQGFSREHEIAADIAEAVQVSGDARHLQARYNTGW